MITQLPVPPPHWERIVQEVPSFLSVQSAVFGALLSQYPGNVPAFESLCTIVQVLPGLEEGVGVTVAVAVGLGQSLLNLHLLISGEQGGVWLTHAPLAEQTLQALSAEVGVDFGGVGVCVAVGGRGVCVAVGLGQSALVLHSASGRQGAGFAPIRQVPF
jgi:hypothetical protein